MSAELTFFYLANRTITLTGRLYTLILGMTTEQKTNWSNCRGGENEIFSATYFVLLTDDLFYGLHARSTAATTDCISYTKMKWCCFNDEVAGTSSLSFIHI